jgi:ankyrin repeat protein
MKFSKFIPPSTQLRVFFGLLSILFYCLALSGCGLYAAKHNTNQLKAIEIGTHKDQILPKLKRSEGEQCLSIGHIQGATIESCAATITLSGLNLTDQSWLWSNNVFFHKNQYMGYGFKKEFLSQLYSKHNLIKSDKNSLIYIERMKNPDSLSRKLLSGIPDGLAITVDVYANNNLLGGITHEGALLWEQAAGDVNITLMHGKKIINELKFEVKPQSKYKLVYNFSTGFVALDRDQATTLNREVFTDDVKLLEKSISEGADVNFQVAKVDPTPLNVAIDRGNIDIVKILLNAGANPNLAQHSGAALRQGGILQTPLIIAAQKGHYEIAELLLNAGAKTDLVDEKNQSPLLWATSKNFPDIISLLLKYKANPDIKENQFGQTALMIAVVKQYNQSAAFLLKGGASPNIFANNGGFPLAEAVIKQDSGLVDLLLRNGTDPNITFKNGMSPLMCAAQGTNVEIANNLMAHGAKLDHRNELGQTALWLAVLANNIDMVKGLVSKGANMDIFDTTHGTTPLLQAAVQKRYAMVEYLVKNGANKNIPAINGVTLRQHALNSNDPRLLEITRFNPEIVRLEEIKLLFDDEVKRYQERKAQNINAKNEYKKKELDFLNGLSNVQLELYSIYTDEVNNRSTNIAKVLLSFRKFTSSLDDKRKNVFIALFSEKQSIDSDADLLEKMDSNLNDRKIIIAEIKKSVAESEEKAIAEEKTAKDIALRNQQMVAAQAAQAVQAVQEAQAAQAAQNTAGMLSIIAAGLNTYTAVQTQKYNAQAEAYRQFSGQYENDRRNRELVNSLNGIESAITRSRRGLY